MGATFLGEIWQKNYSLSDWFLFNIYWLIFVIRSLFNKITPYPSSKQSPSILRIMLQVQDPPFNFSKQSIINYERKLVESPFESLPKPSSRNQSKYSVCELQTKVQEIVQDSPYHLRWIGNGCNSPIESYIYCLLMLSITNNRTLMMFKNAFYELCRKYLDAKEQKLVIQFLCLLQFSSDKYLFLKKYPIIDSIILNVFDKLQAEQKYSHDGLIGVEQKSSDTNRSSHSCRISRNCECRMEDSATGQLFQMNQLSELFSKLDTKFHFLKWKKSSESSFSFTIDDNKKMYIIVERQYFFVLHLLQNTEIKCKKQKLTKGDRIQIEKLLNSSQTEQLEVNLNEKSTNPSESPQKTFQSHQKNFSKKKNAVDSESSRKQILLCNAKNHTAVEISNHSKKQFKFSYFSKKQNSKVEQIHESMVSQQTNQKNSQNYIDLMESSFQEERVQTIEIRQIGKKVQESASLKFYPPKFLMKHFNSPTQNKSNKKSCDNKVNKTEFSIRGRSPSQVQNRYAAIRNTGDKKQQKHSKQVKFYSPPRHSPEKKRNQVQQKKSHDFSQKDNKKDNFKWFDKKYNQKKEEIHKHYNQNVNRTSNIDNTSKITTSLSYNPKIFNNRISLQSRNDLDILTKYKLPTQDLMLKKIPEVDKSLEVSKRQLIQKKHIIREELSQSLNNKSEILLKKKLFEHLGKKFAGQSLTFLQKRNKSLEQMDSQPLKYSPKIPKKDSEKDKNQSLNKQCPQTTNQKNYNSGFQIIITSASPQKPSPSVK